MLMRGSANKQKAIFHTFEVNDKIPAEHPLRAIKQLADAELKRMAPLFREAYSHRGRPSTPPEQLLKASLLQALYSIPSERQLCEQIGYNLLFCWFLDLPPDSVVWDHSTFTKNRERFAEHGFMRRFFEGSVAKAIASAQTDTENFSVDGTLIQSWASMKSVKRKDDDEPYDGNGWADFKGEKRGNETHQSKTDPEALLYKKGRGKETLLCHSMHVLTENENGLVMDIDVDDADGYTERSNAHKLLKRFRRRHHIKAKTLAADKGYDDGTFLKELEDDDITPLVAIKDGEIKADTPEADARRRARERRHSWKYYSAQKARRLSEQAFGWIKGTGGLRRTRYRERWKTRLGAYAVGAAYNFLRLARLGVS
jgi:transposase